MGGLVDLPGELCDAQENCYAGKWITLPGIKSIYNQAE
jgi:hypothetical protein